MAEELYYENEEIEEEDKIEIVPIIAMVECVKAIMNSLKDRTDI